MVELTGTAIVLIFSAAATAALHTVVPDHWLPFVLVGRAQGWRRRATLFYAGISALVHIVFSIALGMAGYVAGLVPAQMVGEWLGKAVGAGLVVFGLLYVLWGVKAHGGILHLGHAHGTHGVEHSIEGRKGSISGWALALLMGLSPCVLALPVIAATIVEGLYITVLASAAFALSTMATLLGLTALGIFTTSRLKLEFFSRYGEIASGVVIVLTGLAFMLLG